MATKTFIKPTHDAELNPVDFFNLYGTWKMAIGDKIKTIKVDDKDVVTFSSNGGELPCIIDGIFLSAPEGNMSNLSTNKKYTKFMLFTKYPHKGNYKTAFSWVEMYLMNKDINYIRVGCDYFKITEKLDRYDVTRSTLKGWKKDEIKQDHGPKALSYIPLFDDFCIVPNNLNHKRIINGSYNLYAPFNHQPIKTEVSEDDIPQSLILIQHLFGDQIDLGIKYMQCLYQLPHQILPILCLVSQRRQTGKTTFLNWIEMIFSDNYVLINPEELTATFNANYANKNIIALDETAIEKSHAIEKLKSLATCKTISVNPKWVQSFSIPFYGKIILCTNKELDFMRIEEEEIRFWVRKTPEIPDDQINTNIENQLRDEIPAFLTFLNQQPPVDTTRSRMVFTAAELKNNSLQAVQKESWSNLRKELTMMIEDFFHTTEKNEFYATASDIKDKFFSKNNNISIHYIHKVVKDEMKAQHCSMMRYIPFTEDPMIKKPGKPFLFKRVDLQVDEYFSDEIPF